MCGIQRESEKNIYLQSTGSEIIKLDRRASKEYDRPGGTYHNQNGGSESEGQLSNTIDAGNVTDC